MRGLWKRWAVALGVVVVAATVSLAQPPALKRDLAETPPFWSGWFGGAEKPAKPKGEVPKADKAKAAPTVDPAPVTVADRNIQVQRLNDEFARRQAVIDKLREIALETDNASLGEEALRLEEMAQKVFQQESGRISGVATAVPQPDPLDGDSRGDQAIRAAAPSRTRGMTPASLERSSQTRGGDR